MGMYTELIFGASLKENIPDSVVRTIKHMCGDSEVHGPFDFDKFYFCGSSYYFPVNWAVASFEYNESSNCWTLNVRFNIKNVNNKLEDFLSWIKPYIEYGSGLSNIYAITIYEESYAPVIYELGE